MTIKQLLLGGAFAAVIGISTPAHAQLQFLGVFAGNDCGGSGGFSNCYATQNGVVQGAPTDTNLLGSPVVFKEGSDGEEEVSSLFPSIGGGEFAITYNGGQNTLSFLYTAGDLDPALHYFSVKQSTGYALFYDANPITSGNIALSNYFPNNPGFSHITFYDTGVVPGVPEPATWAMMLLGFGALGSQLRRRRRSLRTVFA